MSSDAPDQVSPSRVDATTTTRPHARRWQAPAVLQIVIGSYLLFLTGVVMFQSHLLYFPAVASVSEMVADGLTAWPNASEFQGLLAEAPGETRATVVVFHGNAGHAGHRQFYVEVLSRLGLRVILAEYPGYGPRRGELGEQSLVAAAEQTIALARREFPAPLLIVGESLGAGVAAAAASRQKDLVDGLLLITPWDRLANVASHHYPLLPVRWLLRDEYDSVTHLAAIRRPVLVAIADDDEIIPPRFGRALFDALSEPKRLSVIRRAGHNDWFCQLDASWWQEAFDFLLGAAR